MRRSRSRIRSIIVFGTIRIVEDAPAKQRFFDALMAKYGKPESGRPKHFYPRLDEITLYAIALRASPARRAPLTPPWPEQWPALDLPGRRTPARSRYATHRNASTRMPMAAIHDPATRSAMPCHRRDAADAANAVAASATTPPQAGTDEHQYGIAQRVVLGRQIEAPNAAPAASASGAAGHAGTGIRPQPPTATHRAAAASSSIAGRRFAHSPGDGAEAGGETERERCDEFRNRGIVADEQAEPDQREDVRRRQQQVDQSGRQSCCAGERRHHPILPCLAIRLG